MDLMTLMPIVITTSSSCRVIFQPVALQRSCFWHKPTTCRLSYDFSDKCDQRNYATKRGPSSSWSYELIVRNLKFRVAARGAFRFKKLRVKKHHKLSKKRTVYSLGPQVGKNIVTVLLYEGLCLLMATQMTLFLSQSYFFSKCTPLPYFKWYLSYPTPIPGLKYPISTAPIQL